MNREHTRAIIKITEWESEEILSQLNQHSTVEGIWFTRVAKIEGELYQQLVKLHAEGKLKLQIENLYSHPSELAVHQKEIDSQEITMTREELVELVRGAYTDGGDDYKSGNFYWCQEGSTERAEEILQENEL